MNTVKHLAKWFFRVVLDPFELLYMAIAIATLDHSIWSAAFLFEGPEPVESAWWWVAKGLLIAIAVDLGMLMTSRFLQAAKGKSQVASLVAAFAFAALTSFYLQMAYILYHTPVFSPSSGVTQYWVTALMPSMDAHVLLLPLALPVLATIYTLARITRHLQQVKETDIVEETADALVAAKNDLERLVVITRSAPMDIDPGKAMVKLEDGWVDLAALTWSYEDRQRGPYKSRGFMLMGMQQALKKLEQKALIPVIETDDES